VKGHKWFAAYYDRISQSQEKNFMGAIRADLLKDVTGDVLEIGAGTGLNFPHYAGGARVTATEPDPYMLQRAEKRAADGPASIQLQQARAEKLPFPDASFDFVISTLVLCSVPDPQTALAEVKRVLRPDGELRVYEHVRYKNRFGALSQDIISPLWHWCGAGCHPNRDTERHLREAGFALENIQVRNQLPPVPPMLFVRPHLRAIARRPI
jgi:ubiquinone/menaquinone biosynthesis C-methylase UbiE